MALKRGIERAVTVVCGAIDPKTGERANGELDKLSKPVTGEMIAQVGVFPPTTMTRWPHHRRGDERLVRMA